MPPYAFFQKQFIPLEEAKIGIMTHAFHYGTAVFDFDTAGRPLLVIDS